MSDRLIDYLYHPGQLSRRIEDRGLDDLGIMRRIANLLNQSFAAR